MPIPNPDHYLDQAEQLIKFAGGRQAEYRRAISTAYYAVFHVIMAAAADHYIGRASRNAPEYGLAYRQTGHASLKDVCANYKKIRRESDGAARSALLTFASAVVDLQYRRNLADYDPSQTYTASSVRAIVSTARDAVEGFRNLLRDDRLKFLFRLMVKAKERK